MKRIIVRLAVTAILVLALAEPVFAQGQVEQGPEDAKSICSFSGLNETPEDLDPELGGRTQSYGQLVKKGLIEPSVVKSGPGSDLPSGNPGGSPGFYCNPTNVSLK